MKLQGFGERSGIASSKWSNPTRDRGRWVVRLLWLGAVCSMVGMANFLVFGSLGSDAKDYLSALHGSSSLPYSPLFIIPASGLAKLLPLWLMISLFGVAYILGWLTELWVGMQCATPEERKVLRYVAPVIAFFPGLLVSDAIATGNIAYILYGMMLAGAVVGWKRGHWNWFYLAVLMSSCVKVHLLTMLVIPLLCGRRQWMRALATSTIGLSLYALQSRIWPQAFDVYLNTLKTMSHSKHEFGCGPVGNLARVLQGFGVSYELPCVLFYAVYAIALFLLLLWISRLHREGRICFESWAPVMLVGVVLLNPRILCYDVAAVSLPMVILVWRSLHENGQSPRRFILIGAAVAWFTLNVLVEVNEDFVTVFPYLWRYLEMFLMLGIFAIGVRQVMKEAGIGEPSMESFAAEAEERCAVESELALVD